MICFPSGSRAPWSPEGRLRTPKTDVPPQETRASNNNNEANWISFPIASTVILCDLPPSRPDHKDWKVGVGRERGSGGRGGGGVLNDTSWILCGFETETGTVTVWRIGDLAFSSNGTIWGERRGSAQDAGIDACSQGLREWFRMAPVVPNALLLSLLPLLRRRWVNLFS